MRNEPKGKQCAGVMQAAEAGRVMIVTSTWTLTEVIRIKGMEYMTESDDDVISGFFQRDYIALRAVTEEIGSHVPAASVERTVLNQRCHTCRNRASDAKCAVLDTFDQALIKLGAPADSNLRFTKPDLAYEPNYQSDDVPMRSR